MTALTLADHRAVLADHQAVLADLRAAPDTSDLVAEVMECLPPGVRVIVEENNSWEDTTKVTAKNIARAWRAQRRPYRAQTSVLLREVLPLDVAVRVENYVIAEEEIQSAISATEGQIEVARFEAARVENRERLRRRREARRVIRAAVAEELAASHPAIAEVAVGRRLTADEIDSAKAEVAEANAGCRVRLYYWEAADTALTEQSVALAMRLRRRVMWHDNAGTVTSASYKGAWTTTSVVVTAHPDGSVEIRAQRAGGTGRDTRTLLVEVEGTYRVWRDIGTLARQIEDARVDAVDAAG